MDCPRESIEESLCIQGFALVEVLQENETTGIARYISLGQCLTLKTVRRKLTK